MTERDSYSTLAGRKILLTYPARDALRKTNFILSEGRCGVTKVEVTLSFEYLRRIEIQMMPGETYSEAIIRILRRTGGAQ